MAKSLEIKFVIDNAQARAASRQAVADFAAQAKGATEVGDAVDKAQRRAADATKASTKQQFVSLDSLELKHTNFIDSIAKRRAADATKAKKEADDKAKALEAIESKFIADDLKRRTKLEEQRAREAQREVERSKKNAAEKADADKKAAEDKAKALEAIESKFIADDLKRRAKYEEQKAAKAKKEADDKARAVDAIESKFIADDQKRRTRMEESKEKAAQKEIALAEKAARRKSELAAKVAADAEKANRAFGGLGETGDRFVATLTSMAAGAVGFGALVAAAGQLEEVMGKAVERTRQQADELLKLKGVIRETAAIQGKSGVSDADVSKFLNIRKASGLDEGAAKDFLLEYSGANESNIGNTITREESDKAKPLLARFAASQGGGAGAAGDYGRLGGQMQAYYKNQTAEQNLANTMTFTRTLSAGVGANPMLIRQAVKQAGTVLTDVGTGAIKDPQELAALISTGSLASPASSGQFVTAANRALRLSPEGADYREAAGIGEKDDLMTAIGKSNTLLAQHEKEGLSPDKAIAKYGINNVQDIRALATYYTKRQQLGGFLDMAHKPYTPDQAKAELAQRYRTDTGLRDQVATADVDAEQHERAKQFQHSSRLEKEAQADLIKRNSWGVADPASAREDWIRGTVSGIGGLFTGGMSREDFGRQIKLEQEMHKRAKAKGIEVPGRPNDTSMLGSYSTEYTGWLRSGAWRDAYSSVGSTEELTNQVMPGVVDKAARFQAPGPAIGARQGGMLGMALAGIGAMGADPQAGPPAPHAAPRQPGANAGDPTAVARQTLQVLKSIDSKDEAATDREAPGAAQPPEWQLADLAASTSRSRPDPSPKRQPSTPESIMPAKKPAKTPRARQSKGSAIAIQREQDRVDRLIRASDEVYELGQAFRAKAEAMMEHPLTRVVTERYEDGREKTVIMPAEWTWADMAEMMKVANAMIDWSLGIEYPAPAEDETGPDA